MRYAEIVEGSADQVWKATKARSDGLRKLHDKQQKASDAMAAAQRLEPGPKKQERIRAAQDKRRDASRVYSGVLDRARNMMAKGLASD